MLYTLKITKYTIDNSPSTHHYSDSKRLRAIVSNRVDMHFQQRFKTFKRVTRSNMQAWRCHQAQSPLVFNCDLGTLRRKLCDDRRGLAAQWCCNRLEIYSRAIPCKPLKTINKILYCTLKSTGSQCREASTGEILEHFPVPVRSLAAAFSTNCNRESKTVPDIKNCNNPGWIK